jgi:hypothetical protein
VNWILAQYIGKEKHPEIRDENIRIDKGFSTYSKEDKNMSKNKVVIKVHGGLGNQMSCYAMYRYWQSKGINAFLDLDDIRFFGVREKHESFKFSKYFPLSNLKITTFKDYKDIYTRADLVNLPKKMLLHNKLYTALCLKILRKIKKMFRISNTSDAITSTAVLYPRFPPSDYTYNHTCTVKSAKTY